MFVTREHYRIVGLNLCAARQTVGLERAEVARRLNLTVANIDAVEYGRERPTPMELQILCRMYQINIKSVLVVQTVH